MCIRDRITCLCSRANSRWIWRPRKRPGSRGCNLLRTSLRTRRSGVKQSQEIPNFLIVDYESFRQRNGGCHDRSWRSHWQLKPDLSFSFAEAVPQAKHFDSGNGGLIAFVAMFSARAVFCPVSYTHLIDAIFDEGIFEVVFDKIGNIGSIYGGNETFKSLISEI